MARKKSAASQFYCPVLPLGDRASSTHTKSTARIKLCAKIGGPVKHNLVKGTSHALFAVWWLLRGVEEAAYTAIL